MLNCPYFAVSQAVASGLSSFSLHGKSSISYVSLCGPVSILWSFFSCYSRCIFLLFNRCAHCKALSPIWEDFALKTHKDSRVHIAKIDCTVDKSLCAQHNVKGYPTLLAFVNGELIGTKYQGQRTSKDLLSWMESLLPTVKVSVSNSTSSDPISVHNASDVPIVVAAVASNQTTPAVSRSLPEAAILPRAVAGTQTVSSDALPVIGTSESAPTSPDKDLALLLALSEKRLAEADDRIQASALEVARLRRELGREKEDHANCLKTIRKIEDLLATGHRHSDHT
jgi:hypothetical protein